MDNILLSIIIPVYNVEKYIKRCLDSILCQETENYEVILVDDGSTDSSGIICDSYAKCRKNVVCIHKTNGGLSDARNEGLKHCKGKYVWFVDSDDYITEDALESLEKVLCKYSSDVVVCMSKTIDDYGKIQDECHYEIPSGLYSSHEYMEMLRKYPKSVLLCAQFHVVKKTFVDSFYLGQPLANQHGGKTQTVAVRIRGIFRNTACGSLYKWPFGIGECYRSAESARRR